MVHEKLDEQLLMAYCSGFFGYGNPKGKYWFIGLEEAGGYCKQAIQDRLTLWSQKFQCGPIVDCREFHQNLRRCNGKSLSDLFEPEPRRQLTWDRLSRIQLAADGYAKITNEDIDKLRLTQWGSKNGNNCLLELLPLPARNVKDWPYDKWTTAAEFQTRRAYREAVLECRIKHLSQMLELDDRKVVVFYGGRPKVWSRIVRFDWKSETRIESQIPARFHQHKSTLFALIKHPAARLGNKYFSAVGQEIRRRLEQAK